MSSTGSVLKGLECPACGWESPASKVSSTCPTCGHTLFATYDLARLDARAWVRALTERPATLWRYRELLPVSTTQDIVSLGEGFTPIIDLPGRPETESVTVSLKDDGLMPTGSFKARGMAVAVSRARELGLHELFVPSAGNAGVALAAYAARGRIRARIYVPEQTAPSFRRGAEQFGAEVEMVPGTIREAGERARAAEKGRGSFDMSTLREPYRVEGKKTMGLEIFEQFGSEQMPDAIVYPTGGGTGLVGMAKAFAELKTLGLLERPPRLYAVQPEGCAPVVRALMEGAARVTPEAQPKTIAPGLLVPSPFSSEQVLAAIRSTRGSGVAVSDRGILEAMRSLSTQFGVSASPEGAAPLAALPSLLHDHRIRSGERVLLYNTGTGIPFDWAELWRSVG